MRLLALVLLLAGAAWAQEAPFDGSAIGMYPTIEPAERAELSRLYYGAAARAKSKPAEAARVWADLERGLAEHGFDVARLKRMPRGALAQERYNHGVVLEAPELDDAQRAVLLRAVAAVDAAQLAALLQAQRVVEGLDETEAKLVKSKLDQHRNLMEKRFWQVVYYTLTPAQMRAVRELFSPRYRAIPQLEQQMYLLPEMTPAQASRVRALFEEIESEAAADRAEASRCRAQLRDGSLAQEERQAVQARARAAGERLQKLQERSREAIRTVLTGPQLDALRAAPPYLNTGERARPPLQALPGMPMRAEQRRRLEADAKGLQAKQQEIRKELYPEYKEMMDGGFGPESPQQMTMQMMQRGAQAQLVQLFREAGQGAVLEVLEPAQVSLWIALPG